MSRNPGCARLARLAPALTGLFTALLAAAAAAAPVPCDLSGYRGAPGMQAAQAADGLTVQWEGDPGQELRLRLAIENGAPTIAELALRRSGQPWVVLGRGLRPEYSVVTGVRRMSNQQLQPLREMKIPITQGVLDKYRWDPFWDAPLDLSKPASGRFANNPPPPEGLPGTDQPGLPRNPAEIRHAVVSYHVSSCKVSLDGGRLSVTFPGVTLGVFEGSLRFTVFRGSNLIEQKVLAATSQPWVAYKYDAGLKGLAISDRSRVVWRDTANEWQVEALGGALNADEAPVRASHRIVVAEQAGAGSIAAFPPPHRFFWAREVAVNMGYNWYRKDTDRSFSFGIRQNEHEDLSEGQGNWALYSARPGTEQLMPVYFYPSLADGPATIAGALRFTHGDRYKPLPGYQVMNHHYHMDLGERLIQEGSLDATVPDLDALKALGINIVSQIDSVMFRKGPPPATQAGEGRTVRPDAYAIMAASVAGARKASDAGFLVMADQEVFGSPLGGHTDLLFSHPVYWDQRKPGQPFQEQDPKYGKVYHVGGAEDLMAMARLEDVAISMPHPRTKGSTGYPDAIREQPFFKDPHYQGVGMRWGMGVDGSERRLCEIRCWPLLDDMSNWVADLPIPLKYIISISEVRHQQPGDDIYASSPVTYVQLDRLPPAEDPSPVVRALNEGRSFWSTGEVLAPRVRVEGGGASARLLADVEWTFPLDFVEVVWGDGLTTGRKIISTADLPPFSSHSFAIPFDARGKKWVRFAAWDIASNGAVSQPMRLGVK